MDQHNLCLPFSLKQNENINKISLRLSQDVQAAVNASLIRAHSRRTCRVKSVDQ